MVLVWPAQADSPATVARQSQTLLIRTGPAPARASTNWLEPVDIVPDGLRQGDALTQTITMSSTLIQPGSVAHPTNHTSSISTPNLSLQALNCNPTGGSGGLGVGTHDITLAGRPATVIVGQGYNPATPTYLAFYLHGDEGGYNFHTGPFNSINQFIDDNGWIYVAPQAPPDPTDPMTFPWDGRNGGSISGNAALVRNVLDDMFAKYNVCRNILFGGRRLFHPLAN